MSLFPFSVPLFRCKKISVPEFLRSARSSFLLFPIKKENRQRLYNLLSIFILKLIILHGVGFLAFLYYKMQFPTIEKETSIK